MIWHRYAPTASSSSGFSRPSCGGAGEYTHGVDQISELEIVERLPGWRGRCFHSAEMTFAHFEFARGGASHEHSYS
jgi:hypothetical protein